LPSVNSVYWLQHGTGSSTPALDKISKPFCCTQTTKGHPRKAAQQPCAKTTHGTTIAVAVLSCSQTRHNRIINTAVCCCFILAQHIDVIQTPTTALQKSILQVKNGRNRCKAVHNDESAIICCPQVQPTLKTQSNVPPIGCDR